ncbi:hypothetical protein PG279_05745 [Riemerella anatipestifer]|nr:hypothetical protein [Riemerella anatipestifer]
MRNKYLIFGYLIITLIFLFSVVITFYHYSFYGYYTDKIISWLWLGSTLVVFIKFWKTKAIKIYFLSLLSFLLLSILPMAIPFFWILSFFTKIDDYQQINLDSDYRIERTRHQSLSMPRIYIYKRMGIFEKNICRPVYSEIIENVTSKNSFDERNIPIQYARLIFTNSDSIGIEYQIFGKKKIIYHKVDNNDGY